MNNQKYFKTLSEIEIHVSHKQNGHIHIGYYPLPKYEGMAVVLLFVFDAEKKSYQLDIQWECLGLDFYGDTLQENYVYEFHSLQKALAYLKTQYQIDIEQIPVKYSFDGTKFPNPIKNKKEEITYKTNWERFQKEFKKNRFLDETQKLIYSSNE